MMMRTRCPVCATIFRVTPEQLRLKAGKVRCGHCQNIFNAFDQLVTEDPPPGDDQPTPAPFASAPLTPPRPAAEALAAKFTPAPLAEPQPAPPPRPPTPPLPPIAPPPPTPAPTIPPPPSPAPPPAASSSAAWADTLSPAAFPKLAAEAAPPPPPPARPPASAAAPAAAESGPMSDIEPIDDETEEYPDGEDADNIDDEDDDETPEQSAQAARQAGLVAVRDLSEAPDYDRWAAGPLAAGESPFLIEEERRAVWPFVLVALVLILVLTAQLLHHFRTDVVRWLPSTASAYRMLNIAVPLPREATLVAIGSSDLQSDNLRGQFVLQATLRNQAAYAQDWPALELTLTDANDRVVARRVIAAADYLPPSISPERFPAHSETAIRLWIEARDIGAAGYRLYVFYP